MKTLRYLLIAFAAMMALSVSAQSLAQAPEAQMQSTSSMVGTGSTLPQAVQTGAYTTYDGEPARNGDIAHRIGNNGGSDPGPEDPDDPWATPIGDAAWPLALCALAYLIMRVARVRKRALKS